MNFVAEEKEFIGGAIEAITHGYSYVPEVITHDGIEQLRDAVAGFWCLPESSKRGTHLSSRPVILEPQHALERPFAQTEGVLAEAGQQFSELITSAVANRQDEEFADFRFTRAVINRFKGSPGRRSHLFFHDDSPSVGRLIAVVNCDPALQRIEGGIRRPLAPGDLTFLIGSGMKQRGFPAQPQHAAETEQLRFSIAFVQPESLTFSAIRNRLLRIRGPRS